MKNVKKDQRDDIDYMVGWLCGAIFPLSPTFAIAYLLRHRRRTAFQSAVIGIVSGSSIIGIRAGMVAAGFQNTHFAWAGLNLLAFILFPWVMTMLARAIPWPQRRKDESSKV